MMEVADLCKVVKLTNPVRNEIRKACFNNLTLAKNIQVPALEPLMDRLTSISESILKAVGVFAVYYARRESIPNA